MRHRLLGRIAIGLVAAAALAAGVLTPVPAWAAPFGEDPAGVVPGPPLGHGPAGVAVRSDAGFWVDIPARGGEDPTDTFVRAALETGAAGVAFTWTYAQHGVVGTPPDDPSYSLQWHLPAVGVPDAWELTDGEGVVIAVLDSGVSVDADLACRRIVAPYDAVSGTPGLPAVADDTGHGTLVASVALECTDNGIGTAGVAPGTALMPVRVLDAGIGDSLTVARGIEWAVANGADVINLSLGGNCSAPWPTCHDTAMDAAIAAAADAGVIMVASSGNEYADVVSYPAGHPDVIAVGASTRDGKRAAYSNVGEALDLLAPGSRIVGQVADELRLGTGTSLSAPIVSGVAALVRSLAPESGPAEVRSMLRSTATDAGPLGWDREHGAGIVSAAAAVSSVSGAPTVEPPTDPPPDPAPDSVSPSQALIATVDSGGRWHLSGTSEGPVATAAFYYGNPGDLPFLGDWDCDGVPTPGLYRQSDGYVYLRNSNTQGIADITFFFGNPGDVPLVGDFDGDGCDTVSLYRPGEATIHVINALGENDGGLGSADFSFTYGDPNDVPFVGDFDGDGIDSIGLFRPSTAQVYLRNALSAGVADLAFVFGDPGDQVLAADWDGDGDDTLGVYRASVGTIYISLDNSSGAADQEIEVGSHPHTVAG